MWKKDRHSRGFLLAEVMVAIGLLGLIVAGLGISLAGMTRFNGAQWGRQQCIAAAQAQLDSLTATGRLLNDEDIARLWPDVILTTEQAPGEGQWHGLELVQVSATIKAHPRQATVRLARYVVATPSRDEGEQQR